MYNLMFIFHRSGLSLSRGSFMSSEKKVLNFYRVDFVFGYRSTFSLFVLSSKWVGFGQTLPRRLLFHMRLQAHLLQFVSSFYNI